MPWAASAPARPIWRRWKRTIAAWKRKRWPNCKARASPREAIALTRTADVKVTGQTYELTLPLSAGPVDERVIAALLDSFSRLYRERYVFFFEGEPIEIVNLRVVALGRNPPLDFARPDAAGLDPTPARKGRRPVYFEGLGFVPATLYERTRLRPGNVVPGPAIVEEETSSVLIPPGVEAQVLSDVGLAIKVDEPESRR